METQKLGDFCSSEGKDSLPNNENNQLFNGVGITHNILLITHQICFFKFNFSSK